MLLSRSRSTPSLSELTLLSTRGLTEPLSASAHVNTSERLRIQDPAAKQVP